MRDAVGYPFGAVHWLTMGVMFLMGLVIVYGTRRWVALEGRKYVAFGIAGFMFVQEVLDRCLHHYVGMEPWREVLPFHLCGMSVVLTVVMLVTRSKAVFDVLYFWGLAGAGMAILTPDNLFPFPHVLNLTYFWSHALIIVGVAFMMVNYGYRPDFRAFLRSLVITNIYMAIVAPINFLLGTNYLYQCQKPVGATLMDYLGPWPWYIVGLEVVGTVIFFGLYSPYLVWDWAKRNAELGTRNAE